MRYFFRRRIPQPARVLLIESGSRHLVEGVIPSLRGIFGGAVPFDLLTCYAGTPRGMSPEAARIYNVNDYRGRGDRQRLYRELTRNRYGVAAIVCSAEPMLNKWKWVLAARLPAKILVVNENGDYFWLDWGHWSTIGQFVRYRTGFADAGAVRTFARVVLFPFTLLYLLLYATVVHFRRALRRGFR